MYLFWSSRCAFQRLSCGWLHLSLFAPRWNQWRGSWWHTFVTTLYVHVRIMVSTSFITNVYIYIYIEIHVEKRKPFHLLKLVCWFKSDPYLQPFQNESILWCMSDQCIQYQSTFSYESCVRLTVKFNTLRMVIYQAVVSEPCPWLLAESHCKRDYNLVTCREHLSVFCLPYQCCSLLL